MSISRSATTFAAVLQVDLQEYVDDQDKTEASPA
jgi:hypothetical protein